MHDQDSGRLAESFFRTDGTVRPNLHRQLVVVCNVADTRICNGIIDAQNRRENGINRNDPDNMVRFLVLVRRDVSAAALHRHFHMKRTVVVERRDMEFRIQDFNVRIHSDVGSRNFLCPVHIQTDGFRLVGIHLQAQGLQVQDDICNIVANPRNRREFVKHPVNADSGDSRTLQRGEQNTAKAVAECRSVSTLQRLAYKLPVAIVFADLHDLDLRFFDFDHLEYPPQ